MCIHRLKKRMGTALMGLVLAFLPVGRAIAGEETVSEGTPVLDRGPLAEWWTSHGGTVTEASELFATVRADDVLASLAFVLFAVAVLPRSVADIRSFFNQIMTKYPLPAFRKGGVEDEDIAQARKLLFFYCLFLIYQVFQMPLTLGANGIFPLVADLFFQVVLLGCLFVAYWKMKRRMRLRWADDPERKQKMAEWLNAKLDGMNVRIREMRRLALGVFVVSFGPVAVEAAPTLISGLVAIGL